MAINNDAAVEVARRHGLSLMDAHALARLAADVADAERIAREFATPPPTLEQQLAANPGRKDQVIQSVISAKRASMPRTRSGHAIIAEEE